MQNQYVDVSHNRGTLSISYYDMETKQKKVATIKKFKNLNLFLKTNKESEYKSFVGNYNLAPISFENIYKYNEYLYEYSDVSGVEIFGDFPVTKTWISSYYNGEIQFDFDLINVGYFDIETTITNRSRSIQQGVDDADERITSMVLYATKSKKYYVLTDKPITGKYFTDEDYADAEEIIFHSFTPDTAGEIAMMEKFIEILNEIEHIDILSAYFGNIFDFPYIYNRIAKLAQEKKFLNIRSDISEKKLSPLKRAYKTSRGKLYIQGIQLIDFFELYEKYTYGSLESWKLDFIAQKELGVGKIELEGGFMHVYEHDYEKYAYYNYVDVKRLRELDEKLEFMNLHCEVSYLAKQNFEDTLSPVRTWESILYNTLKERNLIFNPSRFHVKKKYVGAYTHEPDARFYNYIFSYDLNSLYPHLFMKYYISPETLLSEADVRAMFPGVKELDTIFELKRELEEISNELPYNKKTVGKAYDRVGDMLINQEIDLSFLQGTNITMAPSLEFFKKDENAVMPYLMKTFYDMRKVIKRKKLDMEDDIEIFQNRKDKKKELQRLKEKYMELLEVEKIGDLVDRMKILAKRWGLKEKAYKILLNSVYGAFGSVYFRFFDIRIAKSITAGGRLAIRSLIFSVERELRRFYEEYSGKSWEGEKFFIYSDTDSCKGDSKISLIDSQRRFSIEIEKLYQMMGGDFSLLEEKISTINQDIQTDSLNLITGEVEKQRINHIWRHKVKKELFKIKTKDREVVVTEDHSIIIKRNDEYLTVKPRDILSTDKIILTLN